MLYLWNKNNTITTMNYELYYKIPVEIHRVICSFLEKDDKEFYAFNYLPVTDVVRILNDPDNIDINIGVCFCGLSFLLVQKRYVCGDMEYYETFRKSCIDKTNNCGKMLASLPLYYISQEPDFNDWYIPHKRQGYYCGF